MLSWTGETMFMQLEGKKINKRAMFLQKKNIWKRYRLYGRFCVVHVLAQMWMAQCFANGFSSTIKFLFHQFVAETISTRYAAASKINYVPRSQFQFEERWVPLLCYNLFYFSFFIFVVRRGWIDFGILKWGLFIYLF